MLPATPLRLLPSRRSAAAAAVSLLRTHGNAARQLPTLQRTTPATLQCRSLTSASLRSCHPQLWTLASLFSRSAHSTVTSAAPPTINHSQPHAATQQPSILQPQYVRVQSCYVAPQLNLASLAGAWTHSQTFSKPDCILIALDAEAIGDHASTNASTPSQSSSLTTFDPQQAYVVIFQYGSIVFFNASDVQQQSVLRHVSSISNAQATSGSKDDYRIVIDPSSEELVTSDADEELYCAVTYDGMVVRSLDLNGLRVISQVLAQTVGLEHHETKVDALMSQFRTLNSNLASAGKLQIKDMDLFKLVATNNGVLADLLTHLRLLDRSDLAWRYGQLDEMLQGLRDEFEIQRRFDALELKLTLMQQSTTFLLEVLHNKKSDTLEWIIIVLIMVEVVISLIELPHILAM